jgi:hypothetical protein
MTLIPTASSRVVRAATAETADLERRQDCLLLKRRARRQELDLLDSAMAELDERLALLARLVPALPTQLLRDRKRCRVSSVN